MRASISTCGSGLSSVVMRVDAVVRADSRSEMMSVLVRGSNSTVPRVESALLSSSGLMSSAFA
jgi:hypothetical protein